MKEVEDLGEKEGSEGKTEMKVRSEESEGRRWKKKETKEAKEAEGGRQLERSSRNSPRT